MEIKLITKNLNEYVLQNVNDCLSVDFAISFIKYSGIELLEPLFNNFKNNNQSSRILFSPAFGLTETKALRYLINNNARLQFIKQVSEGIGIFHSKLWILYYNRNIVRIVIGSSNLTKSAMKSNSELNIGFEGSKNEIFISNIISHFNQLWNSKDSELVTDFFLEDYQNFENHNIKVNYDNEQQLKLIEKSQNQSFSSTFSEIILNALQTGDKKTSELYAIAKNKAPHLCDDSIFCKHGGGYEWQHLLRGAQSGLKIRGEIKRTSDGNAWEII